MAATLVSMFLSVIQEAISCIFSLEIADGVSLGWIFIVVVLMFIIIKFFLGGNDNG